MNKMYLVRVRINGGGYDSSGKYWGVGVPLYRAWNDDGEETYVRAYTREKAKACFPGVKFYR